MEARSRSRTPGVDGRLALDPEEMRSLGYRTVDMLVERLADESIPPLRRAAPDEMSRRLHGPPPDEPEDFEQILEVLGRDVLPFTSRLDHPGFFAFIPACGNWLSALGDFVASACNLYAGSWMEAAGPSQVELEVLGWFKQWVGYPAAATGTLVPGGSAANMTALACARERLAGPMSDRLVIYVSDQAHSSLARGARALGFRPSQLRVLASDASLRLPPATVASAIGADVRAGRRPLLVSANAGATNAGTVDPLPALAELCRERGVWFHVDAAYGGFAALTERGREQLRGIELADSLTLDPHKWLYQPFECGCLLVKDPEALRAAFEVTPDYLRDVGRASGEVNFADLGLQLTRGTRALKIWMSVRYFGVDAFRAAVDRSLDLAELARRRIEESPALELVRPASLGVVCFRRAFGDTADEDEIERRNAALISELERSGIALVSSTRLHGTYAIRLCVLNHTTRAQDVERTLAFLETTELRPGPPAAAALVRDRNVPDSWEPADDHGPLALVPLFRGLSHAELRRVEAASEVRSAATGETLIAQWDLSRELFVVLEGDAEVLAGGAPQRELHAGDIFGELAALDWGAGYGYSRTATVRARSPMRVLAIPPDGLRRVLAEVPVVEARLRAIVRRRLA